MQKRDQGFGKKLIFYAWVVFYIFIARGTFNL